MPNATPGGRRRYAAVECVAPILELRRRLRSAPRQPDSHEGSILLVEDNPDDAVFVRRPHPGRRTVLDGRVSLPSTSRKLAPTCIIADLGLPHAEGMEIVVAIQDAAPAVPVVVLTEQGDERCDGLEAIRAGAEDYLTKSRQLLRGHVRPGAAPCDRAQTGRRSATDLSAPPAGRDRGFGGNGMAIVHCTDRRVLTLTRRWKRCSGCGRTICWATISPTIAPPAERARTMAGLACRRRRDRVAPRGDDVSAQPGPSGSRRPRAVIDPRRDVASPSTSSSRSRTSRSARPRRSRRRGSRPSSRTAPTPCTCRTPLG